MLSEFAYRMLDHMTHDTRDACGQVTGLLARKGVSRHPCRVRGQRLARDVVADGVEAASSSVGCLLMPRRSSPAPWAASLAVLPRAAREAPLAASTCCIFGVACVFLVLSLL
jgi:hypothetical protein